MSASSGAQVATVAGLVAVATLALVGWQHGDSGFLNGLRGRPLGLGGGGVVQANAGTSGDNVLTDDFTIAVGNVEDAHHMRVSVVIEVADAEQRSQLSEEEPRMRDDFIARVADRHAGELGGRAGMDLSKALLRESVRHIDPDLTIRSIYFSDFFVK